MARPIEETRALIDALDECGYEPKSYSGRGMFGKCCVSVSGDNLDAWDVARSLFEETWDGAFARLPNPHQDQLGRGIVLYWPSY